MPEHVSLEELADAAEQLLEPARAEAVQAHLAVCPSCRETSELLAGVPALLAAEPVPTMPPAVVARLDAVLADEQIRRSSKADLPAHTAASVPWVPRPRLPAPPPTGPRRGRAAGWVLVAAVAATIVGFAGYVVSARAGLNEPPPGAAAVSSSDLGSQAGQLERSGDVDPHRFSQAWSCARKVTDGSISGIAAVTVDGSPAFLVYLKTEPIPKVAVVEGCEEGAPRVITTATLTR